MTNPALAPSAPVSIETFLSDIRGVPATSDMDPPARVDALALHVDAVIQKACAPGATVDGADHLRQAAFRAIAVTRGHRGAMFKSDRAVIERFLARQANA